ncbi:methionine synthase reductase-like [Aedes albopictus]|uniref:FAD-binding FR-type domain-containing protein n=1 Tax=Aedes albopictus TaxID=7160 RepID=A0ABM1ZEI7_AEDAL
MSLNDILKRYSNVAIKLPPAPLSFIKTLEINDNQESLNESNHLQINCSQPFEATKVYEYAIDDYRILAHGEDIKSVYDLTLTTKAQIDHLYEPGDTVGILTSNFDSDVNDLLKHLELESSGSLSLRVTVDPSTKKKAAKLPPHVPSTIQITKLFKECLDLRAIPKKLFLRALLDHTTDDAEKQFISLLCSKDGHAYDDIILEPRMGLVALIKHIPSCKPPLSVLIEHLPRLMPRPYSIANYHDGPGQVGSLRIIFSLNEESPGLTTTMLKEHCISKNPVFLYFRKSTRFAYADEDMKSDVVMIGAGTGVAPYLSFLEKRRKSSNPSSLGNAWLFAGFRYEHSSYICREELERYTRDLVLNNLSVAFSRDRETKFPHVQDLLEDNKEALVRLLCESSCKFYVCGDGKLMLPQIERKFAEIISTVQGIGQGEAEEFLGELKKPDRYVEDIWL